MGLGSKALCCLIANTSVFVVSCRQTQPSRVTDVAISGIGSDVTYLYWKDASKLVRGRCETGKPLLRHYCDHDTTSAMWPFISANMLEGRDTQLAQVKLDEAELTKHLASIDEELKEHPGDFDLSADRADTAKELSVAKSARMTLEAQIALVDDFMVKLETDTVIYRMSSTDNRYLAQKPLLEKLNRFFVAIPDETRPSRRSEPTPGTHPVPVTQPGPRPDQENATVVWTDPVTAKVYIGVSALQPYKYAMATCNGITPGKWRAIGPYFPNIHEQTRDCSISGTTSDAARMMGSVLGSMPTRILPDGSRVLLTWSRCGLINDLAVVLSFGPIGPVQQVIKTTTALPVICEMITE